MTVERRFQYTLMVFNRFLLPNCPIYWNFGPSKPVKMTKIGKTRIQSLIKLGYFLSFLKFSDLNSDMKSQPYSF